MSEILKSLKRLNMTLGYISTQGIKLDHLPNMKKEAEKLEGELMRKEVSPPSPATVKMILQKIKQGKTLNRNERKELPFVLLDPDCDRSILSGLLNSMDITKERTFRRLVFVYFVNFRHINEGKKRLLQTIISKRFTTDGYTPISKFMKKMQYFSKIIFSEKCANGISRMFDTWGIDSSIDVLALPNQIKYSDLIVEAAITYFSEIKLSVDSKMLRLKEIISHKGYFHAVFPKIADGLILSINGFSGHNVNEYKKICMDVLYEELGDPRFGSRTVRWNEVSDQARNIFLGWVAEKDLNLFFKIIEKTAVDSMWSYRKKFWLDYLPHITNTWVLFGREALKYVRQVNEKMSYGKLGGDCLPNHSVFAFKIGAYMFVEWSHNGMLRVWDFDYAPNILGVREVYKKDITSRMPLEEWRHSGKETGNWQNKVRTWIYNNCGINI